jgi:hypothetical protein
MFDDLVPPSPVVEKKTPGMFDDLVQQAQVKQKASEVTFHDLMPRPVPNVHDQGTSAPGMAENLFGAAREGVREFGKEFHQGYGDKGVVELWKDESLPANLYHGVKRLAGKEEGKHEDKTDPGIVADLKALGVTAKEHPGLLYGSFVKSLVSDPELLLPWLWNAIPEATAARVAQAARAMGASADAAKAAEVGGRVAGRMAVGGATGAAVEGGKQFRSGQYDAGAVGTAAAEGALFSAPGKMRGKVELVRPPKPPHVEGEAAVEPHVERATNVPSDELVNAIKDDPINPEFIADLAKEKLVNPSESRTRLVKGIRQAVVGGSIGGAIGYGIAGKDDKEIGLETGAALGVVLPLLKVRKYQGVDISKLVNARNGQVRVVARHVYQFQRGIEQLLPDKAQREQLADMIDQGVEPQAGTPMHDAYQQTKQMFAELGQVAKEAGVIPELRDNYISHIVEGDPGAKQTLWQKLFGGGDGQQRGSRPFSRERKYDTFEELQNAIKDSGLTLKTKDASEIAGIYANAVYKSIADRALLDAVKQVKLPDGSPIVMSAQQAQGAPIPPSNWVRMGNPSLAGVSVHPDIAQDLNFVFSHRDPNVVRRGAEALTSAVKRLGVSFSLFHAKTLTEGFILAGGPRKAINLKQSVDAALKMYREGGNNDKIDHLIKNGLILGTPEDVAGHEVQNVLSKLGDKLNEKLPLKGLGVGAAAKALAAIDKGVERFTFGYLQTGMKIQVAMSEYERMVKAGVDTERAARSAASYANDVFGSLDWYRVATDTDSHIMRALGTGALNTNGRKVLQLLMFAPDWTAATFRSLAKAMPGGSDEVTAQLHRRYAVKAAIYYFTVANALNMALSGHPLWDNKDMTRVELGDGRTMQFAKHETEPLEWLRHPVETGMNKAATIPAAVLRIKDIHDRNKAYKKPTPTPHEDLEAIAPSLIPISLQQLVQNGFDDETLASVLGFPIYGKKPVAQKK